MAKKKCKNIFEAIEADDIEAVKTFLPKQLKAKDSYGRMPLNWACHWGNIDIVTLLVDYGADIEAKDNYGYTPLHLSCGRGHIDISELLVTRGADPFIKNRWGDSPFGRDNAIIKDEAGKKVQHRDILNKLRDEYLMNKHALEAADTTAALSSGWEMEL